MCGICGEVRFGGSVTSSARIAVMRDALVHRGPDSEGMYLSPDYRAGLGFRRLRIIDLSSDADQPMANEDGSVQVVFNGEIYNFQSLRPELEQKGHRFRSRSDTEVIVHLYEEEGADAISRLDGMFAIAIWDARSHRLTLARDRVGKKPLFYYRNERLFAFASEIKAFLRHPEIRADVDHEAVPYYFIHGYVPGPSTFYRDVRQVEPGALMVVDADGRTRVRKYWQIEFPAAADVTAVSDEEAAARVRELVTAAVERRLISDVPLGAFLSGGVDSTIVVGLMSRALREPVKTFSVGFEGHPAYDETAFAREAARAFGTDHTEFRVTPSALELIDTLLWHHDGPFGDSSAIPTYLISKLTKQHVTVVLTGDGGDEIFAGYDRFYAATVSAKMPPAAGRVASRLFSSLPSSSNDRSWLSRGHRFFDSLALPLDERITTWNSLFFRELSALLRPDFARALPPIDRLRYLAAIRPQLEGRTTLARILHGNFTSYLADDLLVKTDRCTMANSLEARAPFLDRALVEYVAALPDDLKLRRRRTKFILRRAFADLIPTAINRRRKMGFGVPLGAWFRGDLRGYVRDLLLDPNAKYRAMLSGGFVEGLVARHNSGEANAGQQLWSLICFERWLQLLPEWRTPARESTPTASDDRPVAASPR